jgi:hypothetical protein
VQHVFTRIMNCPPFTKIRAHLRRQLPSCCLRYLILFIINDKPFCYFILHKKWCGSLKVEKESKKIRSITNYNKQKEEKKRLKNNIPIVTKSKVIDQLLYTLKFANISWTLHNNIIWNFLSNNHSCKYQHKASLHIFKFNSWKLSLVHLIYGFFVD